MMEQDKMGLFATEPSTSSVLANNKSWAKLGVVHEFTHLAQGTNYSGVPGFLAAIMGNRFSPNLSSPTWITEGITVYSESRLDEHSGRLNGGYYDSLVAAKTAEGDLPSILEANFPHNHYPQNQFYVYGGTFFRYLAEEYGEEKIAE
jgi:hypothetical protein